MCERMNESTSVVVEEKARKEERGKEEKIVSSKKLQFTVYKLQQVSWLSLRNHLSTDHLYSESFR